MLEDLVDHKTVGPIHVTRLRKFIFDATRDEAEGIASLPTIASRHRSRTQIEARQAQTRIAFPHQVSVLLTIVLESCTSLPADAKRMSSAIKRGRQATVKERDSFNEFSIQRSLPAPA